MTPSTPPLPAQADVPDLARRMGLILAALAALVAARFLRRPGLAALIVPLWQHLTHVARRFQRAMTHKTRPRAACPRPTPTPTPNKVSADLRPPKPRLPTGRGWLVRALGYEGVAYRLQLEALLAAPAIQAAIAALPAVGRVLRPVCRMLDLPAPRTTAEAAAIAAQPKRVRPARPKRLLERPRVRGSWWPLTPVRKWG